MVYQVQYRSDGEHRGLILNHGHGASRMSRVEAIELSIFKVYLLRGIRKAKLHFSTSILHPPSQQDSEPEAQA